MVGCGAVGASQVRENAGCVVGGAACGLGGGEWVGADTVLVVPVDLNARICMTTACQAAAYLRS